MPKLDFVPHILYWSFAPGPRIPPVGQTPLGLSRLAHFGIPQAQPQSLAVGASP